MRHERHGTQMRLANRARSAAVKRLILAHPEEWRRLYAEETEKRGVTANPDAGLVPKKSKVAKMEEELRAAGTLDGVAVPPKRPKKVEVPNAPVIAQQSTTRAEQLDALAARRAQLPAMPGSESEKPARELDVPSVPPTPW